MKRPGGTRRKVVVEKAKARGDVADTGRVQTLQGHRPVKDLVYYPKESGKPSTERLYTRMW